MDPIKLSEEIWLLEHRITNGYTHYWTTEGVLKHLGKTLNAMHKLAKRVEALDEAREAAAFQKGWEAGRNDV